MTARLKRSLGLLALIALCGLGTAYFHYRPLLQVGTAYVARLMCIGVFDGERDPENVHAAELRDYGYIQTYIDAEAKTVTASVLGLAGNLARFSNERGCTLPQGQPADVETAAGDERAESPRQVSLARRVDDTTADDAVAKAGAGWFAPELHTHAVVALRNDQLVYEHYAPGIGQDTRLLGWSMGKSVVHAEIGRLIQLGYLQGSDIPAPIAAWHGPGDARAKISLDNLLRMSSGLRWDENYFPPSDVTRMLFLEPDASAYAVSVPAAKPPGTEWLYSSGTSNILSAIVQQSAAQHGIREPARTLLFAPLGMQTAIAETDASGKEVGSSFVVASARDWARFGLLYLHDGMLANKRLLPAGWVDQARRPTAGSNGRYGAHWWLNPARNGKLYRPELPADAFSAEGYDGQVVMVIPSRNVVLVRLGSFDPDNATMSQLMGGLLNAIDGY